MRCPCAAGRSDILVVGFVQDARKYKYYLLFAVSILEPTNSTRKFARQFLAGVLISYTIERGRLLNCLKKLLICKVGDGVYIPYNKYCDKETICWADNAR